MKSNLMYVKVYKVIEVYETEVDEEDLGDDEYVLGRPALREALRRVKAGEIEAGPVDCEFVALAWDEVAKVSAAALVIDFPQGNLG